MIPLAESPASLFSTDQYADCYPAGIEDGYWTLARNWMVADALGEARRRGFWAGGPALEIGCGPGIVVQHLRSRGIDAWGVELAQPQLRSGVAPNIVSGVSFADLPQIFRDEVTAVLLLDVIEHIEDPATFLKAIVAAFPNCRCFLVTVPARQELWSNYDLHYGHHRRYDHNGLATVLDRAGLRSAALRYFFRPLYVGARLLAALDRPRETVLAPPRHRWLHYLLACGLHGFERLLRPWSSLPGSSLLAIATRVDVGSGGQDDRPVIRQ